MCKYTFGCILYQNCDACHAWQNRRVVFQICRAAQHNGIICQRPTWDFSPDAIRFHLRDGQCGRCPLWISPFGTSYVPELFGQGFSTERDDWEATEPFPNGQPPFIYYE